jgi:uncharacterized protein HemX
MNKLLSPSVLSLLVGASALTSVILCVMQIQYSRQIRTIQSLQQQLAMVQQRQLMMQQLAADLYTYSKTNAAIKPLLDSAGIKPAKP